MEWLWNIEVEKPLSAQSFLSYCENLEDNVDSSSDYGGLACKVSEQSLTVHEITYQSHLCDDFK